MVAQSAGAEEYTDCTSAEGKDPCPYECPGYYTKSDGTIYQPLRSGRIWHKVNF